MAERNLYATEAAANLVFANYKLTLRLRPRAGDTPTKFDRIEVVDHKINVLKFSTPQLFPQKVTEVPVVLIKNFEGERTISLDIKAAGFTGKEPLGKGRKIESKSTQAGRLYRWSAPTMASAEYFYLENPKIKSIALRVGPFPSLVANDVLIDWAKVKWPRRSAK